MANKKKAKKSATRPDLTQQDSLRRDIEASRNAQSNGMNSNDGEEGDGFDIADELLATLDARDKADQNVQKAEAIDVPTQQQDGKDVPRTHSERSDTSDKTHTATSPLRTAGEKLLHVGEKMFSHHHRTPSGSSSAKSPPLAPSSPTNTSQDNSTTDANLAQDMQRKGSIGGRIFGRSPNNSTSEGASAGSGKPKVSRQRARMERKAAQMEAQRVQAQEELKANGGKPDEAERERVAIKELCDALHVQMHEITPDGHCLYAAIADQINLLGKSSLSAGGVGGKRLTYADMRKTAAEYMRAHSQDFMPFISDSDEQFAGIVNKEAGSNDKADAAQQEKYFLDYCDAVEKTAVWGGQPEILALSRAYHTPVHVVQAGSPVYKVGAEEGKPGEEPVVISYHRHMYGLGEHYNSLHKLNADRKQGSV